MKIHKKILAMSTSIMLFAATLVFSILLLDSNNYTEDGVVVDKVENDYKMYIKGDNLVRLLISERFHSCAYGNQVKRCGLIRDDVIKATNLTTSEELPEYIDGDAFEVANDIISNDSGNKITIQTNWTDRYSEEELKSILESDTKEVNITFTEDFNESDLKRKEFVVKFDAKNGSEITEVTVPENGVVKKPKKPTKKGYTFVRWELKGKKYNFNKEVKKDITLEAKWKKK